MSTPNQSQSPTTFDIDYLERITRQFQAGMLKPEPVVFVPAKTTVPGVKLEYHIDGERLQFHVWPDKKFPANIEACLRDMVGTLEGMKVDYVPEVKSWYVEGHAAACGALTDWVVERLVEKLKQSLS